LFREPHERNAVVEEEDLHDAGTADDRLDEADGTGHGAGDVARQVRELDDQAVSNQAGKYGLFFKLIFTFCLLLCV
jgi:hypothetical protein